MINSFKLVDHLFILTKGGPDNASNLLLYYIYEVAFSFFDEAYAATLTVVLLGVLAAIWRSASSSSWTSGSTTDDHARGAPGVAIELDRFWRAVEVAGAWLLAVVWLLPLLYAFWAAFHPPEIRDATSSSSRRSPSRISARPGPKRPSPATSSTPSCWSARCWSRNSFSARWPPMPLPATRFAGRDIAFYLVLVQLMIMPEVLIVENYRTHG